MMNPKRSALVGVVAGVSLLIAATASADDGAMVDIQVTYPEPVIASPGDTVEVEVSVVGLVGWQSCEIRLPAASEAVCEAFQVDFNCDESMWDALSEECDLTLCSCVAATENELVVAPPLSIRQNDEGDPDCEVIPPGWQATFTQADDAGTQRLTADLPGDFSRGGVKFAFDARSNFSAKLYTCRIDIAADAAVGVYPLPCASPASSDPSELANVTGCVNGSIEVVVRPTATPTATSVPTATSTPRRDEDDGGCAVVKPVGTGSAWWTALPALALLWRRRRPN